MVEAAVTACIEAIEQRHFAREQALKTSRSLIRECANIIRALHRREFSLATGLLAEAQTTVGQLHEMTTEHAEIYFAGYTQDALKEYCEAQITAAMLSRQPIPLASDLGVPPAAYLNGLAEAASELRRAILDGLRRGEVAEGERLLTVMDDVYSMLVTVDYPDAITGGLRRTTDALRAVLERTRGDMTAALRQEQLTQALAALEVRLLNANEPPPRLED